MSCPKRNLLFDPPPGKATVVYKANSRVMVVFEIIPEDQNALH